MIPLRDNIPSRKIPFVNYCLIVLNVLVFFYQYRLFSSNLFESFIFQYSVIPLQLLQDPVNNLHTLVTSQFLHGGAMHLIGNVLYLYIFGDNVEDRFGHIAYLIFYLFCGVCAASAQIYFNQKSAIPMIGASGAIAGILGSYFLLYPSARILTLVPLGFFSRIIEVPALLFLGFWFIMQTFSGTASLYVAKAAGEGPVGVAWFAHAGGFLYGFLYTLLSGKRRR